MSGIAGIAAPNKRSEVSKMLTHIAHRGKKGKKIIEVGGVTIGAVWSDSEEALTSPRLRKQAVWDGIRPPLPDPENLSINRGPLSMAAHGPGGFFMARDALGVRPLYHGKTRDGCLCFASEVKALLELTREVYEFPAGHWADMAAKPRAFFRVEAGPTEEEDVDTLAFDLRLRLEQSICRRIDSQEMGCWLSGGLDSSVISALIRPHVSKLHTFAGGLPGAPDIEYAREMAAFLKNDHHEVLVTLPDLVKALPQVIYHLESFDALLVRSTLLNFLVAEHAARYVGASFSGEGGDELFGGYEYLKDLPEDQLPDELVDIIGRLHNTALQRVDRSANAHGLTIFVPFLDPDVVDLALRIPAAYKIMRQDTPTEKWILRKAMVDSLPEDVLWRPKSKFWQGSGIGELLAEHAARRISDEEFIRERKLANGWVLNTKEELFYYRIFKENFGDLSQLDWMGRTKGAPRQ